MSASQGRERRRLLRHRWLGAALAASGLHLATGAAPALACHIAHHAEAAHAAADDGAQDLRNLTHLWQQVRDQNPATPAPTSTPVTTTSAAMLPAPAAEMLPPINAPAPPMPVVAPVDAIAAPTVANWHQGQASNCPPPPPCTCSVPVGSMGGNPPPMPSTTAPLAPPAAESIPAPEPSTLLTAALLAGAFAAWRRRSAG